ncbi:MAG: helix-turn-helix domain-containing protein [Myxococcota bacterium]
MQDPVTADVARRVRLLRTRAGLSIEALAERAGIPPETLARIERGRTSPTLRTIGRIASGLGTEPVTFFWKENATPVAVAEVSEHVRGVVALLAGMAPEDVERARSVLVAMFAREK